MQLNTATPEQLRQWESELLSEYENLKQQQLNLDLTRGKPSSDQLSLSDALDGILKGDYTAADGTDTRNYGGLDGIGEAKALGAELLGVSGDEILVGGNSSLTLMYLSAQTAFNFGLNGPDSAWNKQEKVKFLCPVPGYDRHFSICEQLGIEMVTVPMLSDGPDMDVVEQLIKDDSSIRGMWCVPKYSNPTGIIYSDATVNRIAQLGNIASPDFRVFWDNAYAVHDLNSEFEELANIMEACRKHGTESSVLQFCSTSKITQAGAGISFMGASSSNLSAVKKVLSIQSIGPDKVNQLRHLRFLPNKEAVLTHMQKHAALLRPRFECVLKNLEEGFGGTELGTWEAPEGGYFVSFDCLPNVAKAAVKLSADAGVKLTPAGATFPYGNDPQDRNIRIAPSVPSVEELDTAMKVFVTCVKLASVQSKL